MRRTIKDKRVLITGASSGIGRAMALEAAHRGAKVVLASRSAEKLEQLADQIHSEGGVALAVPTDVTQPEQRQAMFRAATDHFGGLDILINNAGIGAHGHFIDLTSEILRQIMEVNFFATAENCRLAIPMLTDGQQPLIVNVSSMAGRRGVPAWTEYSASKFAVCGFSEALRAELARFEIDLMLVVPGLTQTNLKENLLAHKGRLPLHREGGLPPEAVANLIMSGIEKNKSELRIEKDARLLLFINWLAPRYINWRMRRVVKKLYAPEIAELHAKKEAAAKPAPVSV